MSNLESELVDMTRSVSEKRLVDVPLHDLGSGETRERPNGREMRTLRRVSGRVPWTAYTIAFVELCERFTYYGTTAVCGLLYLLMP